MFVKICGTTTEDDALLAVAMGADAVGFIFAPSKRQVQPSQVRDIVRRLPAGIMTVGVFRDEHPNRIRQIVQETGLNAVQLHGHELPADVHEARKYVRTVIKAFPSTSRELSRANEYGADYVLVDSDEPGSGQIFDWRQLGEISDDVEVILAGGLNPENVGAAIEHARPFGVDVASGVEERIGYKDPTKLRRFIVNAREAAVEVGLTVND